MEAVAKLRNYPTSPRKMRLLADLIRGKKVDNVLAILEHNAKHPAVPLRKLVLSAISNWKAKNEGGDVHELFVKTVMVDGGRTLKRMRPAPQGRGYRVRKRSNHVTLVIDARGEMIEALPAPVVTEEPVEEGVQEETVAKKKSPAKKTTAKKTATKKTTTKKTK